MKMTILFLAMAAMFAMPFAQETEASADAGAGMAAATEYTVDESSLIEAYADATQVQAEEASDGMAQAVASVDAATAAGLNIEVEEFLEANVEFNASVASKDEAGVAKAHEKMRAAIDRFREKIKKHANYQVVKGKVEDRLKKKRIEHENRARDAWVHRAKGILNAWEHHIANAKRFVAKLEERGGDVSKLNEIIGAMDATYADLKAAFEAKDKDKVLELLKELKELNKQLREEARSVFGDTVEARVVARINATIKGLEAKGINSDILKTKHDTIRASIAQYRRACAVGDGSCRDEVKNFVGRVRNFTGEVREQYKEHRETVKETVRQNIQERKQKTVQRVNATTQNIKQRVADRRDAAKERVVTRRDNIKERVTERKDNIKDRITERKGNSVGGGRATAPGVTVEGNVEASAGTQ